MALKMDDGYLKVQANAKFVYAQRHGIYDQNVLQSIHILTNIKKNVLVGDLYKSCRGS